jgi:hypothetical protein
MNDELSPTSEATLARNRHTLLGIEKPFSRCPCQKGGLSRYRGTVGFAGALLLALLFWLPATVRGDNIKVVITVDNSYAFGFGDSNGIFAGQFYGGVDNLTAGAIGNNSCYVFVPPDNPVTDDGPEIYNITNANFSDYIYIISWSDDFQYQGTVAAFTDTDNGVMVTTSPTAPSPGWQVFATGIITQVPCTNSAATFNLVNEAQAQTNSPPPCPPSPQRGPPLNGYPSSINSQIALADAAAGPAGSSSVGWIDINGSTFDSSGLAHGRLDFSGQHNGNSYISSPPACLGASAIYMEYNPDPTNPACNPFMYSTIPGPFGLGNPGNLREYLIYRIGPLGQVLGFNTCVTITNQSLTCINSNQTYLWNFCVTNNFTNEIQYLSIPNPPPGVSFSEDIIKLPVDLLPGQGTCLSLYVTNQSTNNNVCFEMGAHNTNFFLCCSITNCLTFTPCCAYIVQEGLKPVRGQPNCYTYTFTLVNTTPSTIQYVELIPESSGCLSFNKDIIMLPTPLQPNQSETVTTTVCITKSTTCTAPYCFLIALANSNFVQCCSSAHCLPPIAAPIVVASPADQSVFTAPANIPLAVATTTDITFTAVSYLANGVVVASNSTPPFSDVWSNAPAGQYAMTADGVDSVGSAIWESDLVTIYVQSSTNGLVVAPLLTSLQCVNNGLNFCFSTVPGVTYYVETTTSLSSPVWTTVQTVTGNGEMATVTNAINSEPRRFYRVRVSQ